MTQHYDYFVIGAGSGGVRSARIAAQHGAKVGIAEGKALGGTCVNVGCVPKKLLAYGADYGFHFEDAKGYGWDVPENVPFNWQTLLKNKNAEIERLNNIYENLLAKGDVDLIRGFAKFVDNNTLDIDGTRVTADKILIAVGGTPRRPDFEGAEHVITSDEAFYLDDIPKRVVIEGGGYVAVEFAHIFHGLGAHVTMLYRGSLFLRSFDYTMRLALAEEMRKTGIDVHMSCDIHSIKQRDDGSYTVFATHDDVMFDCDLVMAAIGRDPLTDNLGLENTDIEMEDNGQIKINDDYETTVPHIYAVGDVANHHPLTPVAIQEGHVVADRLFNNDPDRVVNYENIATAIFSYPPCAAIGLCEEGALSKGYDIRVYDADFRPMKHSLSGRDERCVMKLVVDDKTDKILGLHIMGLDAPEMVQGFAVAMNCGATKADFDRTIAIHPTAAEELVTMRNFRHMTVEEYNEG